MGYDLLISRRCQNVNCNWKNRFGVEQLRNAKQYQELLFNGMFSKLLTRASKVPGALTAHKILAVANGGGLWDSKKAYLLLPLSQDPDLRGEDPPASDSQQIDWTSITDTAAAAQKFRAIYTDVDPESSSSSSPESSSSTTSEDEASRICDLPTPDRLDTDHLQMAFGVEMKLSDVVNTVVLTIHTGMIYTITKVYKKTALAPFPGLEEEGEKSTKVHKKTALAPFPDLKEDGKESEAAKFANYSEYFAQK